MALRFLNSGYFAGKVGIGTDNPLGKLHVKNVGEIYTSLAGSDSAVNFVEEGGNPWRIGNRAADDSFRFSQDSSSLGTNVRVTFADGGNVGIGTTSPSSKLTVVGLATAGLNETINIETGGVAAEDGGSLSFSLGSFLGSYPNWRIGQIGAVYESTNSFNGALVFKTSTAQDGGTEKMRITSAGYVGIGTTDPSQELEVAGTVKADVFGVQDDSTNPSGNTSTRVTSPAGATYDDQNNSASTGVLSVILPSTAASTMLSFTIRVFDYANNESFDVNIAGYWYGSGLWTNTSVRIESQGNVERNFNVRFGKNSTTNKGWVGIGEITTAWSYVKFAVLNFQSAHVNDDLERWNDLWDTAVLTSLTGYTTLVTKNNNQVNNWARNGEDLYYGSGSGNVGIGTTSPQANTSLDVRGNQSASDAAIKAYAYGGSGTSILGNGYATSGSGTNYGIRGLSTGSRSTVVGSVNVGGYFSAAGGENNYALITETGNVGIGTTSPAQSNLVVSPSTQSADVDGITVVYNPDGATNRVRGQLRIGNFSGVLELTNSADAIATYITAGGDSFFNGGDVGIGLTNPAVKLDVFDSSTYAENTIVARAIKNYVGGSSMFRVGMNAGSTTADIEMNSGAAGPFRYGSYGEMNIVNNRPSSKINFVNNASIAVTINDDGYVGIGDNTPTVPLEVSNSASTSFTYHRTGVSANKWGFHSDNDATYWQNVTTGNLLFTLQNAGNVGINTTQPSEKLDVNGNARVRNLTAGIVTSSATGVLSTGGPTPMNMSLGESYAANIREKYYRTNRSVYPSTIGSQFAQLIQQDLLNSMSLIMSPVATQTSEVSSVRPENNSGDFSFTRATKASRVASSGYIVRQTENYIRYSNEFNNSSYWTLGDATVTWGQADYFGKSTAWKLQDTASTAQHFVRQTTGVGGVVTVSVYAKAGTKSFLYIRGVEGTTSKETFFNLSAGTVGTVEGITASMEAISNGWYRCSASFDHNPPYEYYFGVADADNVTSYAGDGTGNIYIVNSQIESGIGVREYNATTSSMFYGGETFNVPRIDYKNGVPELLLEKTSTNVVYCSAKMAFLGNTTQSFSLSPEGILNGIKINEIANTGQHYGHVNCSVVAGTQYFLSFYIKKGTASTVTMYTQSGIIQSNATVNLDNGTISASGTDSFIEDVGGGWYRAGYKTPAALVTATSMDIYLPVSSLSSYAGDVDNYTEYYGIQLETAPIITSHIPTYSGAVTRNDEIITLSQMATNTIASNATAATLMVEFSNNYTSAGDSLQWHQSPTIIGRGYFYVRQIGFADSWGASGFSTTDGVNTKVIWRLNSLTSGSFFKDGVKSSSTVTGTAWADINKLVIRSNYGTMRIRNIFMASTDLTDAQCIKLTTINE